MNGENVENVHHRGREGTEKRIAVDEVSEEIEGMY
jgi:hypothetical protein